MPIFRRAPQPAPPIPADLPPGEECDRSLRATLLQGKAAIKGALYLTNRRLMFYADRGDARWLIVPFDEVKSAGLYPAPRTAMGAPGRAARALFIETTRGEQVWCAFDQKAQDEWLAVIRERAGAAAATDDDG
jgi:hypothetical protein